jgi:hypothetical protein
MRGLALDTAAAKALHVLDGFPSLRTAKLAEVLGLSEGELGLVLAHIAKLGYPVVFEGDRVRVYTKRGWRAQP